MGVVRHLLSRSRPRFIVIAVALVLLVLGGVSVHYLAVSRPRRTVCVVISPADGPVKGLESAEEVYEWRLPGGGSQMLAVFTGSDWEAGPLGVLSLGAADIAVPYGRVVCSGVTPQAEEFLSEYKLRLPVIYRSDETYVDGKDVGLWFPPEDPETLALMEEGPYSRPERGRFIGDSVGTTVRGTCSDGSVAFEWHWNGKQYEKTFGTMRVTASSVVVLFAGAGGFSNSGCFPDGSIKGEFERAIACAGGRAAKATWVSKPHFGMPLILEYPGGSGDNRIVRLPKGRIWFEILRYDEHDCWYGE